MAPPAGFHLSEFAGTIRPAPIAKTVEQEPIILGHRFKSCWGHFRAVALSLNRPVSSGRALLGMRKGCAMHGRFPHVHRTQAIRGPIRQFRDLRRSLRFWVTTSTSHFVRYLRVSVVLEPCVRNAARREIRTCMGDSRDLRRIARCQPVVLDYGATPSFIADASRD